MTSHDDDDVLAAFFENHPEPRARDIIAAAQRHPHLAQRLIDMAAKANAASLTRGETRDHEADQTDLDRVSAAVRSHLETGWTQDVEALLAGRELTREDVAADLGLSIGDVDEIVDGLCTPPMPAAAARRFSEALQVAPVTFEAAFRASAEAPRIGMSKSRSTPKIVQRTFTEMILASDLSDERKAAWLAD